MREGNFSTLDPRLSGLSADELKNWKVSLALDGDTLFAKFLHFIDIMYWVFGDIAKIKATFTDFTYADTTELEDSGLGCINFRTFVWKTNMESSITVVGSKGSFKVGGQ